MGFQPLKTIGKKNVNVATRWVKNSEKNLDEDSPWLLLFFFLHGSDSPVACYPLTKFIRSAGLLSTLTIGQGRR